MRNVFNRVATKALSTKIESTKPEKMCVIDNITLFKI